jgi:hypothetical protein
MLSDSILLSIIASSVAILGLVIRFCYNSKCTHVDLCCGVIKVTRETHDENVIVNNQDMNINKENV